MGRLDPAKSRKEGRGTIEGKGTSFYFHQGQTLDIIYPHIPRIQGENRYYAARRNVLSGLPVSLFEFSRFLRWRPHVRSIVCLPRGLFTRIYVKIKWENEIQLIAIIVIHCRL